MTFLTGLKTETLDDYLKARLSWDFKLGDESLPVRYSKKKIDGHPCYFIINDSDKTISTSIQFRSHKPLTEFDPSTGGIRVIRGTDELILKPFHGKIFRGKIGKSYNADRK